MIQYPFSLHEGAAQGVFLYIWSCKGNARIKYNVYFKLHLLIFGDGLKLLLGKLCTVPEEGTCEHKMSSGICENPTVLRRGDGTLKNKSQSQDCVSMYTLVSWIKRG